MGCDIHTRIEYLNKDGIWVSGDLFRLNPYYSGNNPEETDPYSIVEVCDDRNYDLFAVLANVRNYAHNDYIDDPRGISIDACDITRKDYEAWFEDAHSASWFTLQELMNYNEKASSKIKRRGMVSQEDSEMMDVDSTYKPHMWCKFTNASGWVYREWEEEYNPLDHLIEELIRRGEELYLWYSGKKMKEKADTIRFIFWFDN